MFKIREITQFEPKITKNKHFSPLKCSFYSKMISFSEKLSIFAHELSIHNE